VPGLEVGYSVMTESAGIISPLYDDIPAITAPLVEVILGHSDHYNYWFII
jgi:hypothetical protein